MFSFRLSAASVGQRDDGVDTTLVCQLCNKQLHLMCLDWGNAVLCTKTVTRYTLTSLACCRDWAISDAAATNEIVAFGGLEDGQIVCLHIRVAWDAAAVPSRDVWSLDAIHVAPTIQINRQELLFTFSARRAVVFMHLDAARGFLVVADETDDCAAMRLFPFPNPFSSSSSSSSVSSSASMSSYPVTAIDLQSHNPSDSPLGPRCMCVLDPDPNPKNPNPSDPNPGSDSNLGRLQRVLIMRLTGDRAAARGEAPIAILGCSSGQVVWFPCAWIVRGSSGSSSSSSSSSGSSNSIRSSSSSSSSSPPGVTAKSLVRRGSAVLAVGLGDLGGRGRPGTSTHLLTVEKDTVCGLGVREVSGLVVGDSFALPGCYCEGGAGGEVGGAGGAAQIVGDGGTVVYAAAGSLYAAVLELPADGGDVRCGTALLSGLASPGCPLRVCAFALEDHGCGGGLTMVVRTCGGEVVVLRGPWGRGTDGARGTGGAGPTVVALQRLCGFRSCSPGAPPEAEGGVNAGRAGEEGKEGTGTRGDREGSMQGQLHDVMGAISAAARQQAALEEQLQLLDTAALQLAALQRLVAVGKRAGVGSGMGAGAGAGLWVSGGCIDLTGWAGMQRPDERSYAAQFDFTLRAGGLVVASCSTAGSGSYAPQEPSAESLRLADSGVFLECTVRTEGLGTMRALHGRHVTCAFVPLRLGEDGGRESLCTATAQLSFQPPLAGRSEYAASFAVPLRGNVTVLAPYAVALDVQVSFLAPSLDAPLLAEAMYGGARGAGGEGEGDEGVEGAGDGGGGGGGQIDCGLTVPLCRYYIPVEVVAKVVQGAGGWGGGKGETHGFGEGLGPLDVTAYVPAVDGTEAGSADDPAPRVALLVAHMQAMSVRMYRSCTSDPTVLQAPFCTRAPGALRYEHGFSYRRAKAASAMQAGLPTGSALTLGHFAAQSAAAGHSDGPGPRALDCFHLRAPCSATTAGAVPSTSAAVAQLMALTHAGSVELSLRSLRPFLPVHAPSGGSLAFAEGDVYSLPLAIQDVMRECAELLDGLYGDEAGEGGSEELGELGGLGGIAGVGRVGGEEGRRRRLVGLYSRVRSLM